MEGQQSARGFPVQIQSILANLNDAVSKGLVQKKRKHFRLIMLLTVSFMCFEIVSQP